MRSMVHYHKLNFVPLAIIAFGSLPTLALNDGVAKLPGMRTYYSHFIALY